MAIINRGRRKPVVRNKEVVKTYTSYRKGLNTFLLDSELSDEEIRQAENLRIIGKGILEPRPGTGNFFLGDDGNTITHLFDFYTPETGVQLMSISDSGFLTKKSGTSYTRINGASFASGSRPGSAQIFSKAYIVDGNTPLKRYDGTTLLSYTLISKPTSVLATKSSTATGAFSHSYRVTHESDVGETLATDAVTIASLPQNLSSTDFITLSWAEGAPTGSIAGTVIYGRELGGESYMVRVPQGVTTWIDDGVITPSFLVFPPEEDTTEGPIAKHINIYQEKLLLANLSNDPHEFKWSGTGNNIDKFHYSAGGGFFSIERGSKDRLGITGLSEREGEMILFKGSAIYQAILTFNSSLGINEATVAKLVDGVGCISGKTVQSVENSVMFVAYIPGRGLSLAKLDYEPNILSSVLRFQPISSRIQSEIDQVNFARIEESWAVYHDKKYYWFVPVAADSWTCYVYDFERSSFTGPWTLNNAWSGGVHFDSANAYHLLIGKDDGNVIELAEEFSTDEGTDFTWTFVSKKDNFKEPFRTKTIVDAKTKLRDVSGGSVTVEYIVEGKNGLSTVAKSITITPVTTLAGWGSRAWGRTPWGLNPSESEGNSAEIIKYSLLNKSNIISTQIKITGTGSRAKIISSEIRARLMAVTNIPNTWRS